MTCVSVVPMSQVSDPQEKFEEGGGTVAMSNGQVTVIESPEYQREVEMLKADPIVRQMALEIKGDVASHECGGHEFMLCANAEYRQRGGNKSITLGGVPRAIKSLLIDWERTGEASA